MRQLKCLRCGARMNFAMQQKFLMGEAGFLAGDWPHILAGALELEVWFCPDCGKAEFFVPGSRNRTVPREEAEEFDFVEAMVNESIDYIDMDGMPQKKCPTCGREHDFDFPKCPYCKHYYYEK